MIFSPDSGGGPEGDRGISRKLAGPEQLKFYRASVSSAIGAQLGGQTYAEVVFLENKETMDSFKAGDFALSAQATATAAAAGASANAKYKQGVAVFTMAKGGLMFEASVGGQKFKFTPSGK
jgi:lipid-binding SYLF domain-containing protein